MVHIVVVSVGFSQNSKNHSILQDGHTPINRLSMMLFLIELNKENEIHEAKLLL
jgi:hypothetical protein